MHIRIMRRNFGQIGFHDTTSFRQFHIGRHRRATERVAPTDNAEQGAFVRRADGDEIGTVLGIVVILQADGFPAGEGRDVHRRDLRTKVPKIRVKGRAAQVCRPYDMTGPVSPYS